jgi:deoxyhypusine synthase
MASAPPSKATDAVLVTSEPAPEGAKEVRGVDWLALPDGQRLVIANFVGQLSRQGFQSSSIGDAIRIINDMVCPS